jgi:hypothetical protein
MADGGFLGGWKGPTQVAPNGEVLPLIDLHTYSSNGSALSKGGNDNSAPPNLNASQQPVADKITAAAAKYGVDPNFALRVAHTESGFNQSATSPKGAIGVMQLTPGLAKDYGIDPHDLDQNIDTGVKHLSNLGKQFPTNALVAAAYNAGAQAVKDHGGIPPFPETQDYVQKVAGQSSSSNQITDDDLKGATPVVTRGSVGVVARPDNQVSDEDLAGAKPYLVGNQAADNAPPVQAPKSPGYQKALAQAQQNPNALGQAVTGTLAQVPGVGLATNIPGAGNYINSALNGFLAHGLPVIQGSANAIGQALHNLISKKSGVSAGEAYAAGRDASQQALSSYGKQHPILNTAADLGGQVGASALIPEAKGVGLAARLLSGAAKVGGQSALTGAGGAASEGQSGADIAKSAAVNGALGTVLSPVGELGQGAAMLGKSAGTKAALRYLTPAAATGAITGGATYHFTHNPADAALAALGGSALAGAPGLAQSKIAQKALSKVITSEAKSAALMHLTKAIGAETPEGAAAVLASKPGKSVVEALNEDHRQNVMQTAGELNPNNLQHAQQVIEARQHPTAVKERLKGF